MRECIAHSQVVKDSHATATSLKGIACRLVGKILLVFCILVGDKSRGSRCADSGESGGTLNPASSSSSFTLPLPLPPTNIFKLSLFLSLSDCLSLFLSRARAHTLSLTRARTHTHTVSHTSLRLLRLLLLPVLLLRGHGVVPLPSPATVRPYYSCAPTTGPATRAHRPAF
jgi:hypothetical protein